MAMEHLFLIPICLQGSVSINSSEVLAVTLVYTFCPCPVVVSVNVGPAAVYLSTEYGQELF